MGTCGIVWTLTVGGTVVNNQSQLPSKATATPQHANT